MNNSDVVRRFCASWMRGTSLACVAVALSACGGGSGGEPATADTASATETTLAAADGAERSESTARKRPKRKGRGGGGGNTPTPVPDPEPDPVPEPPVVQRAATGNLYFASYGAKDDPLIIANPAIAGGLYNVYWSEIETSDGVFDWSKVDQHIATWAAAGKGVALRIKWSSSGYWPDPMAKTPTPQWVLSAGAGYVYHADSGTEVPLFWDPIYLKHAHEFLAAFAARYDKHPGVLFVDATPGAETNPYRAGTIDEQDPGFAAVFAAKKASDGTQYSDALWWATLQTYIGSVKSHFKSLPVLVTLNRGALAGAPSRLEQVGDLVAAKGIWVGQNGLKGSSNTGSAADKWLKWNESTQVFFEMAEATGNAEGTMQQVVDACLRVRCDWLNVYKTDVAKGTPGESGYDASWDQALQSLAANAGK